MHFQRRLRFHDKGSDIWLYTLSDLFLLLMIFFVLLFGMALKQQDQPLQTVAQAAASPISEERSAELTPPDPSDPASSKTTEALEADLIAMMGPEKKQQGLTIGRNADRIHLTFPERIAFGPGQAQLKDSAQPILDKVAFFVSQHSHLQIEVHGHTDDRPIHNNRYPSNWELSVDRATQVAKVLIQLGVDPSKLSVKGYGEYRALYANDSDLNRSENRRVEIQFTLRPRL